MNSPPVPSLTGEPIPDPEVAPPPADAPALDRLRYFLFYVPREPRTNREIIAWWEHRRFAYNAIVGVCGSLTWILVSANTSRAGFFVEPVIFVAIVANILYCLGWLGEIILQHFFVCRHRHRVGKWLMTIALSISLFVVLAPAVVLSVLLLLGIL